MDSAELYLVLTRPNLAPIWGESVFGPFLGQIEIASWGWNLMNQEEAKRTADKAKKGNASAQARTASAEVRAKTNELMKLVGSKDWDKLNERERTRKIDDYFSGEAKKAAKKANDNRALTPGSGTGVTATGGEGGGADGLEPENEPYKFTFSKRVDCASTQMLNSMKAGDILPTAVLTVFQRSPDFNTTISLVFTIQRIQFTEYKLKVDSSETMTDLLEEWTATYEALAYVYKNRGIIDKTDVGSAEGISQTAAKVASQGTVRAFTMKSIGKPV